MRSYFKLLLFLFIQLFIWFVVCVHLHMPQKLCRGQRMACGSLSSLSSPWVLEKVPLSTYLPYKPRISYMKTFTPPRGCPGCLSSLPVTFMLPLQLHKSVGRYIEICQVKLREDRALSFEVHNFHFPLCLISGPELRLNF